MERETKIEKINAYKKLIETKKLPKTLEKGDANDVSNIVAEEINREFQQWAESQLASLLGEAKEETDFLTEEEKMVLKAYAQRLIKQINNKQAPQAAPQNVAIPRPATPNKPVTAVSKSNSGTAYEEEELEPNQPIGNRLKIRKGQSIEDALEALDRMGPKF